jgi:uncharacterized membrane protein YdjX (TVP38/TMEM64 family)
MKRAVMLTLLIVAAVILSKVLVEDVAGIPLDTMAGTWLSGAGAGSAVLIVALLALDVFLPVPSSLVMVLSGAAFGVGKGAALALLGSVAGEWLGFELVRRFGRRAAAWLMGSDNIEPFEHFFQRHGVAAIIITRPLPIVMETMSLVAGLSTMSRSAFLGASLAGTTPIVLVYAYAGAFSREAGSLVPAAVILTAVTGAGWLWFRSRLAAA